jgi:hypothetical protein
VDTYWTRGSYYWILSTIHKDKTKDVWLARNSKQLKPAYEKSKNFRFFKVGEQVGVRFGKGGKKVVVNAMITNVVEDDKIFLEYLHGEWDPSVASVLNAIRILTCSFPLSALGSQPQGGKDMSGWFPWNDEELVEVEASSEKEKEEDLPPPVEDLGMVSTKESLLGRPRAPGAVGFQNLGNTCFMNSVNQVALHESSLNESHHAHAPVSPLPPPLSRLPSPLSLPLSLRTPYPALVTQCMSNMGPITEYLIAGKHELEINEKNIMGSGGKVSE